MIGRGASTQEFLLKIARILAQNRSMLRPTLLMRDDHHHKVFGWSSRTHLLHVLNTYIEDIPHNKEVLEYDADTFLLYVCLMYSLCPGWRIEEIRKELDYFISPYQQDGVTRKTILHIKACIYRMQNTE